MPLHGFHLDIYWVQNILRFRAASLWSRLWNYLEYLSLTSLWSVVPKLWKLFQRTNQIQIQLLNKQLKHWFLSFASPTFVFVIFILCCKKFAMVLLFFFSFCHRLVVIFISCCKKFAMVCFVGRYFRNNNLAKTYREQ